MKRAPTPKPWIRCPRPRPDAAVRLFCLPYAGGGAMIYRAWGDSLPATVEVCPVQLPGREDRLGEAPFTELLPLAQTLGQAILPYLDKPFAFFGHSMGALIAYELAHELRRQTGKLPLRLLVSGRGAPHLPATLTPISALPETALFSELQRRYGGIPQMLWQEPELRALLLPQLRADLAVVETYAPAPAEPLPCPLRAFCGKQDHCVDGASLAAWRSLVRDDITVQMFDGDHFYLNNAPQPLLQAIAAALGQSLRAPGLSLDKRPANIGV
ncbi:MAG: thioesterase II family protein [Candidatus Methylumidiphilus sp.]